MKEIKISLTYKRKKIRFRALKTGLLGKIRGLMFRKRNNSPILFFDFEEEVDIPFHSLFVFFPFFTIWLDKNNRIIEKRVVYPFKFKIKINKKFQRVIEIPFNKKYSKIINLLDEK